MSDFGSMELLLTSNEPPTLLPSMLDIVMARRVIKGVKPALRYALETLMGRMPLPHTLFEYFDEIFCLGLLLAEWKSINSGHALIGEGLFGLRRSRRMYIQQDPVRNNDSMTPSASGVRRRQSSSLVGVMVQLSSRDKIVAVLLAVLLPYAKDKLEKLHRKWSERELLSDESDPPANNHQQLRYSLPRQTQLSLLFLYPAVNLLYEGSFFVFQWLYLYRRTLYFDPTLAMIRQVVRRKTRQELERERKNAAELLGGGTKKTENSGSDGVNRSGIGEETNGEDSVRYGQWVLVVVLLAFKAVEWWVTADEGQGGGRGWYLGRNRSSLMSNRITPSPPSQPMPSQTGLPIPENEHICALCGNIRTNPVVLRVSGFVFCYRCAVEHLRSVGKCPITLLPCKESDVCKIYDEEGATT